MKCEKGVVWNVSSVGTRMPADMQINTRGRLFDVLAMEGESAKEAT
jgi:hypothetical protein